MTTQEIIADIGVEAGKIRQSSEYFMNPPARDASERIIEHSTELQIRFRIIVETLRKIATANPNANGEDMKFAAQAALNAINE